MHRASVASGPKLSAATVTRLPSAIPWSSWKVLSVSSVWGVDAAATAMASAALNFSMVPWPMAAIRAIQSTTAGVRSRMPATDGVRVRVNHSGW